MPAGPPLTQARRITADSSSAGSPRVRWPRALMPTNRGRYPPPAVAIPSPPAGCLVPGLMLPQACRSREITPPSVAHPARRSREIMPPSMAHRGPPFAGDHAAVRGSPRPAVRGRSRRRPAADSSPWIQSTCSGQECRFCLVVPTGTF